VFRALFGLGLKQPVFGGGGGGGGGGGSAGGSNAGAPKGAAKQPRASSPAGKKTPGTFTVPSSPTSGRSVSVSDTGQKSIAGAREGGGYGQDYNNDGRITFGETLRDMTDRGGPGQSGGVYQGGGILSTAANVLSGNFGRDYNNDGVVSLAERGRDMTDGGGAGQSGDTFVGGGLMGAVGNLLGGPSRVGFQPGPTKPLAGAALTAPVAPSSTGGGNRNDLTTFAESMIAGDPRITLPVGNLTINNPLASQVGTIAPATPADPNATVDNRSVISPGQPGGNLANLLTANDVRVNIDQGPLFQQYLTEAAANPSLSFSDFLQSRFQAPMAPFLGNPVGNIPEGGVRPLAFVDPIGPGDPRSDPNYVPPKGIMSLIG
jgi:hypothetical protein